MRVFKWTATVVVAYLLGSIPTGYLVSRWRQDLDVFEHGSRRMGAANVLRLIGWKAAVGVAIGDAAKGAASIALARRATNANPWGDLLAGLATLAGHNYSAFIGFKGGRGVATGAAATVMMAPVTALVGRLAFLGTIAASRYVSLGSIIAAASMPPTLLYLALTRRQPLQHFLFAVTSSLFIVYQHRDNIARLRTGTERKLGEKV
jgi:acyl phosphate:glycerol-3-phosphate acyltransferase